MFNFYQKRKLRSWLNAPLTQGVLGILFLLLAYSAYVRFDIAMEMSDRRERAEQTAALLEARKAELTKKVDYLSGERGIESELRRQFDVTLPGERVVVIVDDGVSTPVAEPLSSSTPLVTPWYQFWR